MYAVQKVSLHKEGKFLIWQNCIVNYSKRINKIPYTHKLSGWEIVGMEFYGACIGIAGAMVKDGGQI
jgi:hypothetical protein